MSRPSIIDMDLSDRIREIQKEEGRAKGIPMDHKGNSIQPCSYCGLRDSHSSTCDRPLPPEVTEQLYDPYFGGGLIVAGFPEYRNQALSTGSPTEPQLPWLQPLYLSVLIQRLAEGLQRTGLIP